MHRHEVPGALLALEVERGHRPGLRAEWHVSVFGKVLSVVLGVGCLALGTPMLLAPLIWADAERNCGFRITFFLVMVGGAIALAWTGFRPSVTLTESEVIVRNWTREHRIALTDINDVQVPYEGLTIQTPTLVLTSRAVAKWNLSKWLGRHTRADDVVARLRKAATSAQETRRTG